MKLLYTIILLCAMSTILQAENPKFEFSRIEAVRYTLKNNRELQAIYLGIAEAKSKMSSYGKLENPTIGIEYGNDWAFKNEGEYAGRISISQKFPLTGRLSKEKDIGNIDVKLAEMEFQEASRNLALQTELIYVEALSNKQAANVKREVLALLKDTEVFMEKANKSGEVSSLDLTQISQEIHRLSLEILEADIIFQASILELKNILGLEDICEITLSDDLEIDENTEGKFNYDIFENRPDYQMFKLAQHSAQAEIALIKAKRYDDVEIGIYYDSDFTTDEPTGKSRYHGLGLSLSIPLPLNSYSGNISEKRSAERKAEAKAFAKELQIKSEVASFAMQSKKYYEILKNFNNDLKKSAEKNLFDFQEAYKNGQVDLLQVFKAQQSLRELNLKKIEFLSLQNKNAVKLKYAKGFKIEKENGNEK